MRIKGHGYFFVILLTAAMAASQSLYASTSSVFDSDQLRIKLTSRTPQQMAAFYEARGFSKPMLNKIKQFCFITVYIKNKSQNIIWLDLSNWTFKQKSQDIGRIHRQDLKRLWEKMNIPMAHQATFRWTLLPEQLDFRPNEREGGNIVLPWTNHPFQIEARFNTLANKAGKHIIVRFENIQCNKGPS